jgi:hypothetical protein
MDLSMAATWPILSDQSDYVSVGLRDDAFLMPLNHRYRQRPNLATKISKRK